MSTKEWLRIYLIGRIDSDSTYGYFIRAKHMRNHSWVCQAKYRDYLSKSPNENFLMHVDLEPRNVDLAWLVQKKHALNQYEKLTFVNDYGKILDLLSILINGQMFELVLHFLDPCHNCFTFGTVDLTLIIEEYTLLLWLNT